MRKKPSEQVWEGRHLSGVFQVANNHGVHGEMTLEGGATLLNLTSREPFGLVRGGGHLIGTLHDLTKISVLNYVVQVSGGIQSNPNARRHLGSVFPHYVILGTEHLADVSAPVEAIRFVMDEASTLFYDFDAIGSVINARRHIRKIANSNFNVTRRKVPTGSNAQILYFSGKNTIFSAKTVLGTVSATHNVAHEFPAPKGIALRNVIKVGIQAGKPIAFKEAIERARTVLRFMEMVIGRPQSVIDTEVDVIGTGGRKTTLKVYWCWAPKRNEVGEGRRAHPGDVLLSPAFEPAAFGKVLRRWLFRQQERQTARARFSQSFDNQRFFSVDRLTGAANMFDLLPMRALSGSTRLPKGVKRAIKVADDAFRVLPESPQRNSVLENLARLKKPSLRAKIESRAKIIQRRIPDAFPELSLVIREAVSARNLFVHGTEQRVAYAAEFHHTHFFTDMLEFIFAASELVEAGWEIEKWIKQGSGGSHPFGELRVDYRTCLSELKKTLVAAKAAEAAKKK
jgi:hypothetical protein